MYKVDVELAPRRVLVLLSVAILSLVGVLPSSLIPLDSSSPGGEREDGVLPRVGPKGSHRLGVNALAKKRVCERSQLC